MAGADRIYFNRGGAAEKAYQWNEAADDFQKVATISPQLAPVRYKLGTAFLNLGRYQEALEQFDTGMTIQPDDGQQYFGKGLALMRLHDAEHALQSMKKSCDLGDQNGCFMFGVMKSK